MTIATRNGVSTTSGDFESALDYLSTVGYDVAFLRGDARRILADNPISETNGTEHFEPTVAPRGALRATGPWAARLVQGGGCFIDELAGTATWPGSLDLPASARRVADMIRGWMDDELSGEADMIARADPDLFPKMNPVSEQFYGLRDSIYCMEQWLPGSPTSRPAFTILLAFAFALDEVLFPVETLDATVFLGRRVGELWDECADECGGGDDAVQWLGLARDSMRSSAFLQNREKLAYMGLVQNDKDVHSSWDTTTHYMLRAETAFMQFAGFCLCAYMGLPFREDLAGAVGIYSYAGILVLDFCKRATKLGAGSFTEVALNDKAGELQGRAHLLGAILTYGEDVLPPLFLCVLRPYVLSLSSAVDVLDRYRERSWGFRLPVGQVMLCMMMAVLEKAGGSLTDEGTSSPPCASALAAEVVEMMGAREAYEAYRARPSVDAFYRLPRLVRQVLQMDGQQASQKTAMDGATAYSTTACGASKAAAQPTPWLTLLAMARAPPLPPACTAPTPTEPRVSRLGAVRVSGADDRLQSLALRSPARPGGYAAGRREFVGRAVGSGSKPNSG